MRVFKFQSVCLTALMISSLQTPAWAASLKDELSLVLQTHPQLRAATNLQDSTKAASEAARGANLPSVDLTSDYGYEWISNPSERANSDGKNDSSLMRNVVGVTVTQKIFDGYATPSNIRSSELGEVESKYTRNLTEQNILFEAISAYIDVLKQLRRIEFALENEENIKTQLELEDERVRRGSGIGIDVLNAKSRLQTAKDQRVGYEGELDLAVTRYEQVFGHAPDFAAMRDPQPPLELLPENIKDAEEQALKLNPNLILADLAAEKSQEAKRAAKSGYYPTVDLKGAWGYEEDKGATIGKRREYSVLVEANWNLFSGFATENGVRKSIYDYEASKETIKYTTRKTVEGARLAWHGFQTARERLELLENDMVLKEEIFLSTRKQRESGAQGVDVLNVLDREKEVSESKIKYADIYYDSRIAAYNLLLSTGRLTPQVLALSE